ncbi:GGDEF domain-containing protein [Actinoplanes sp. NPDC026670]|uniref:GGDEF domain-containing protein n=1 Tax=Actinoplanes sp. NPDC026670 TaxID=3154700 RepID=UPI0033C8116A
MTAKVGRPRAAWPLLCVLLIVAYLAAVLLLPDDGAWTVLARGSVVTLASLVAGAACLVAARQARGTDRWGWNLLGAGLFSTTAGNALWLWHASTSPAGPPFPALSDVLVIAMVPLSLAGAAALGGLGTAGIRVVLDGLMVSGSLLFLSWCTLLGRLVQDSTPSLLQTIFIFASPIGDVALASMAFILLARTERQRRSVFALVGSGMLAVAVAESGFAYMMQIGAYSAGNLAMNGWIVGFLLIGTGALRSRRAGGARSHGDSAASRALYALPYLPLLVALVAGVFVDLSEGGIGTFAYLLTLVIVVLVVARQLVALRDIVSLTRELRAALGKVRHLATHDPLTGLPNRALLHSRIEETPAPALLYIDLDGFKQVNDTLGHAAGDKLLVAVADRLRTCVRSTDTVARLGGDEFAILTGGAEPVLTGLADRVVRVLGEPFDIDGAPVRVGASVGLAWHRDGEHLAVDELLRRADRAMYVAKSQGKHQYICFEPALT